MMRLFELFKLTEYAGVIIGIVGLFTIMTMRSGMARVYTMLAQIVALIGNVAYIFQLREMNSVPNYRWGLVIFATECLVPYFALLAVTEYRQAQVDPWMKIGMLVLDLLAILSYATNSRLHILYLQTNFTTNGKFNYFANIHSPIGWLFVMVIVLQLFTVCVNCMMLTGKRILHFMGILPLLFMALSYLPLMQGFNTNQWSYIGSSLFLSVYFLHRLPGKRSKRANA